PHPGYARVTRLSPYGTRGFLRVFAHGAKFVEYEDAAVLTGAGLAVQDGTGRFELDGNRHDRHHGSGHNQPYGGKDDVEKPLDDFGSRGLDEPVSKDQPARSQLRYQNLAGGLFVERRPVLHGNAPEAAFEQGIGGKAASTIHLDHDDDVWSHLLDDG